ncbi:MAG: beta-propeller fold lactonase family protein, partial [Verrucomicrobiales bacterium]
FDPRRSTLTKAETQSSLPPEGYAGEKKSTSDIEVHPSGRFVYIANRGHNSLAAFAIDPSDRTKLTLISHASTEAVPRSFNIAPNGKFIVAAGQQTGKLAVYRIQENGSLEHTSTLDAGKSPAWVQIVSKPADSN